MKTDPGIIIYLWWCRSSPSVLPCGRGHPEWSPCRRAGRSGWGCCRAGRYRPGPWNRRPRTGSYSAGRTRSGVGRQTPCSSWRRPGNRAGFATRRPGTGCTESGGWTTPRTYNLARLTTPLEMEEARNATPIISV